MDDIVQRCTESMRRDESVRYSEQRVKSHEIDANVRRYSEESATSHEINAIVQRRGDFFEIERGETTHCAIASATKRCLQKKHRIESKSPSDVKAKIKSLKFKSFLSN